MTAKCRLRHIALSVRDAEASAKFFEDAFGMKRVGTNRSGSGIYMSDGVVNVALLAFGDRAVDGFAPGFTGIAHFGMWVDDLEEAGRNTERAGGKYLRGEKDPDPDAHYEVKYASPEGVVFDLTENGWAGAAKDVVPAPAMQAAK